MKKKAACTNCLENKRKFINLGMRVLERLRMSVIGHAVALFFPTLFRVVMKWKKREVWRLTREEEAETGRDRERERGREERISKVISRRQSCKKIAQGKLVVVESTYLLTYVLRTVSAVTWPLIERTPALLSLDAYKRKGDGWFLPRVLRLIVGTRGWYTYELGSCHAPSL